MQVLAADMREAQPLRAWSRARNVPSSGTTRFTSALPLGVSIESDCLAGAKCRPVSRSSPSSRVTREFNLAPSMSSCGKLQRCSKSAATNYGCSGRANRKLIFRSVPMHYNRKPTSHAREIER